MNPDAPSPAVALLLVMGLPGSGKTTLCHRLVARGGQQLSPCHWVHLEFDAFLPDPPAVAEDAGWKSDRQRLLRCLGRRLRLLRRPRRPLDGDDETGDEAEASWQSRVDALLPALLPQNAEVVLLMDDNFYYTSMRHAVYQLARMNNCGFGTVYMKAGMGQLNLINAVREKPVPDGVLERMSRRLEAPNPERNPWEKFTFVLTQSDMGFLDSVGHYSDNSVNGRLHALIDDCLAHPFEPLDTTEADRLAEESREVCSLSLLHQADLRLRAIVSDWLLASGTQSCPEAGKSAADAKRTLLRALRDGQVKVPARLNAAYTAEMRDDLDAFLRQHLSLPDA